jgi:hypothetical protein
MFPLSELMLLRWDERRGRRGTYSTIICRRVVKSGFDASLSPVLPAGDGREVPASGPLLPDASGRTSRGIEASASWHGAVPTDLPLRDFLRLGPREAVPDHSWLSKTRGRLLLEVHDAVFA